MVVVISLFIFDIANAGKVQNVDNLTPDVIPSLELFTLNDGQSASTFASNNGNDTIGTERELILFLAASSQYYDPVQTSIGDGTWTIGFTQDTDGYSTIQLDGFDASPALTLSPGLGGVDLTSANAAYAFYLEISADHNCVYVLTIYGSTASVKSSFTINVPPTPNSGLDFLPFFIPFTSFTGNASFKNVFGIELTMDSRLASTSSAIDTTVYTFATFGYVISGSAYYDCNVNGALDSGEAAFVGATVTLFNVPGNTVFATTTTDSNGNFAFLGLGNFTYSACVTSPGATNTNPANSCRTAVLSGFQDVTGLLYGLSTPSSLTAPANRNVAACGCIDPTCTGFATGNSCGGGAIVFSDVNSTSICPRTITRTWSITGTSTTAVQIITVTDSVAPLITTQAVSQNLNCSSQTPSLSSWVSAQGFAVASDCNTFNWTSNWDNVTPHNCGVKTITFTATDFCGNVNRTTATWAVFDDQAPTFSTLSSSTTAQCDRLGGSDFTALNNWLSSNGGSVASDNCESTGLLTKSNNYVQNSLSRGCFSNATVTFSVNDNCGNIARTTSTFSIIDTQIPIITTGPTASSAECTGTGSATTAFTNWLGAHAGAVATDACSAAVTWTNNAATLQLGCNVINTVTFTATDACGLFATTDSTFLISDNTAPRITRNPTPLTVSCTTDTDAAFSNWVANQAGALAVDDCTTTVNWSDNSNTIVTLPVCGTVTVIFTAVDLCSGSRSTSVSSTFTVTDTNLPTFTTNPSNLAVECNSNIVSQFNSWLASNAGAAATDSCSSVTITNNFGSGTIPSACGQSAVVSFIANDGCGNSAFASATFSVVDTSPPVIAPLPASTTVECVSTSNQINYNTWLSTNAGAGASDTCGSGVVFTRSGPTSIALSGCTVTQTVVFIATDSCGLKSNASATYTIQDTLDPVLTNAASDRTVECDKNGNTADFNSWRSTHGGATAQDQCSSITWSDNFVNFVQVADCTQSATVTFTATDLCGKFVTTIATYTISDTQGPSIVPPGAQDSFSECDGYGNTASIQSWLNANGGATAVDQCDTSALTWTNNFGSGAITTCASADVIFTVSDRCGFSTTTEATFTVVDTTTPFFNPPASNVSVECDGAGNVADYSNFVSSNGGASADDVCATAPVTWTNTAPATGPVGCGFVNVAFIAADDCGNEAVTRATYTVVDSILPVINPAASNLSLECDGTGNVVELNNWLFSNGGAAATDSCSGIAWSNNFKSLTKVSNCVSAATVTFTVSDACGNLNHVTATFSSVDSTSPSISPAASPLILECDAALNPSQIQSYLRNRGGASAIDLCSSVSWTNNFKANPDSCGNGVGITFTASDACGNTATTDGSITVDDSTAPEFVSFPVDLFIECDGCYDVECTGTPVISDDCAAVSSLSLSFEDFYTQRVTIGFCPGDQILTRTWTAADSCGNFVSRNQTIVIQIARPNGPCTPSVCPSCEDNGPICCEENSAPLACNPVSCKAVTCLQVPCTPVQCIPQVCGVDVVVSPTPIPAPPPPDDYYYLCEPFYVYVYNDDGNNAEDDADPVPIIKYIYEYVSYGDASTTSAFSFITFVIVLLSLIF